MRLGFGKRILALGLSIALCVSDAVPAFAEDAVVLEQTIDASGVNDLTGTVETESESKETETPAEKISEEVSDEEASETVETDEEAVEESEAEETVEATEEEAEEVEITDEEAPLADVAEPVTYTVELDEVTVTVTLSDKDDIPADAVLTVKPVSVSDAMESAVESALDTDEESVSTIVAYDISFVNPDGSEAEPKNPVTVSIVSSAVSLGTSVFHYAEDGTVDDMNADVNYGEASFETSHFSTYVLCSTDTTYKSESVFYTVYCSVGEGKFYIGSYDNGCRFSIRAYVDGSSTPSETVNLTYYGNEHNFDFEVCDVVDEYSLNKISYHTGSYAGNTISNSSFTYQINNYGNSYNYVDIYLTTASASASDVGTLKLYNYSSSNNEGLGINNDRSFKFKNGGSELANHNINVWTSDSTSNPLVRAKIVKSTLNDNGNPTIAYNNESLDYLFPQTADGSAVLSVCNNVTGLFQQEDGYYVYDSDRYYATLNTSTGKMTVTEDTSTKRFEPFATTKSSSSRNDSTSDNYYNYFGLTYETDFIQPAGGQINNDGTLEDMIFEFSGDDDVWVFIDGVLVLDIGGVHSKASGSINFRTGVVTEPNAKTLENGASSDSNVSSYNSATYTIRDLLIASGKYTAADFEEGSNTFSDYSQHTMKVFYFERGAVESNFKIKFNLQTIPSGTAVVTKQAVNGTADADYTFSIKKNDTAVEKGTSYDVYKNGAKTGTGTVSDNGQFTLKDGESAYFSFSAGDKVVVTEENVNATKVLVNGTEKTIIDSKVVADEMTISSSEACTVLFKNEYLSDDLTVTKTASVVDYDKRTYKIDITADYNGTDVSTNEISSVTNADVVLVFDTSGSMIFTDAAIISGTSKTDVYNQLDKLDKSKIYFSSSISDYSSGDTVCQSVKDRLLSTSFGSNSKYNSSSMTCYNIPDFGCYFFYDETNKAWYWDYIRYITYSSEDALDTRAYYGHKITNASDMPNVTTVYTNRSEMLVTAATNFVNTLAATSSDNRVSVITFNANGASKVQCSLTKLDDAGKTTVLNAIKASTGIYCTGTYPNGALSKAVDQFASDADLSNNYTIYFADGTSGETINTTTVRNLQSKSKVYAIGAGSVSSSNLNTVASTPSSTYVKTASDASKLASAFSSISTSISQTTIQLVGKATITDYIDDRFYVTDETGKALTDGAKIDNGVLHIDEENDVTYVLWTNENAGHGDDKWTGSIYVKAKEDFLGGNNITTNTSDSYVTVGRITKTLPQPTVNVKALGFDVSGGEETIFLGDEVVPLAVATELSNSTKAVEVDGTKIDYQLAEEELESLVSSGSLEKEYSYAGTDDVVGKITYTLAGDLATHTPKYAGKPYETYTYSVVYTPYTVEAREGSTVGTEATSAGTASAEYKINVVDGTIRVVKVIDIGKVEWTDGDPIFTFEITNNATGKTITKIAHFKKADFEGKTGKVHVEIAFTGLAKGSYTVKELNTLGYTLESISNEVTFGDVKATYSNVTDLDKANASATAALGTTVTETLAAVQMENTKLSEYFMDRDEVTNSVTKDASGTVKITTSRTTEEKTFKTKEELDAYVSKKTTVAGGKH